MKLDQFPGLNTANNLYELGFNGLVQADNVDISREGSVSRRAGQVKVYSGNIDSAWGDGKDYLFMEGGSLKQLNPDYTATILAGGLIGKDLYVLRSALNRLYWSTGYEHGVIDQGVNRDWSTFENNYWNGTEDELAVIDSTHQDPMPVGKQMIEYAGRLWVVYEDMIIYSDPYSELTDLRENFIPMGERITNLGFVSDGLIVTTDSRSYFLAGRDPAQMSMDERAPYGGIPNTMIQVDGRVVGQGQNLVGLLWASSHGICSGLPNGSITNITQSQIEGLSGTQGAALLRELNGQRHYLAVLQN